MITCYVIDDEFHAVEILRDFIENTPGLELVGYTTNPLVGLDFVTSQNAPDLTFVDINMPELSGLEFATLVNLCTTVIFTTAYDHFAVQAFEKEALDYLLKPITKERFLKCVTKYKKQSHPDVHHPRNKYFYIKGDVKGKMIRITTTDITYIEGALNYIIIHTGDGKHEITYLTMGELQANLPGNFSRIHRSYIVNTDKITTIGGNNIILEDRTSLNIGSAYKDSFFEHLDKRLVKTKRIL